MGLKLLAVLVHLVLLASIYDVLFMETVVRTKIPGRCLDELLPKARRVALIVTGGEANLFSDLQHTHLENEVSFIKNILLHRGVGGVATSKFGAGNPLHEVLGGFSKRQSSFGVDMTCSKSFHDYTFNYVNHTYYFGSPEIAYVLSSAAIMNWTKNAFPPLCPQDNLTVFDTIKNYLFFPPPTDKSLQKELNSSANFFLLIPDPIIKTFDSSDVLYEVSSLSKKLAEVESWFDRYFQDSKTAFIFLMDQGLPHSLNPHSLTVPHLVNNPFLAWGAGIRKKYSSWLNSKHAKSAVSNEDLKELKTGEFSLATIDQKSIAVLVSTLLGTPIPSTNEGQLPRGILDLTDEEEAVLLNDLALQLLTLAVRSRRLPILGLGLDKYEIQKFFNETEEYKKKEDFENLYVTSQHMINKTLESLESNKNFLKGTVRVASYLTMVAWGVILLIRLFKDQTSEEQGIKQNLESLTAIKERIQAMKSNITICRALLEMTFIFVVLFVVGLIVVEGLPLQFNFYYLLPLFLWWHILSDFHNLIEIGRKINLEKIVGFLGLLGGGWLVYCMQARIRDPELVSKFFLLIVPIHLTKIRLTSIHPVVLTLWIASTLGAALTSSNETLPDISLTKLSALALVLAGVFYMDFHRNSLRLSYLVFTSICLVALSWWVIEESISDKFVEIYYISPIIIATGFILPFFGPRQIFDRLCLLTLSLAAPFLLVTVRHEALAIFFVTVNLLIWICFEARSEEDVDILKITSDDKIAVEKKPLRLLDLKKAILFAVYMVQIFSTVRVFETTYEWSRAFGRVPSCFGFHIAVILRSFLPLLILLSATVALVVCTKSSVQKLFAAHVFMVNVAGIALYHDFGNYNYLGWYIWPDQFALSQAMVIIPLLLYPLASWMVHCKPLDEWMSSKILLIKRQCEPERSENPNII